MANVPVAPPGIERTPYPGYIPPPPPAERGSSEHRNYIKVDYVTLVLIVWAIFYCVTFIVLFAGISAVEGINKEADAAGAGWANINLSFAWFLLIALAITFVAVIWLVVAKKISQAKPFLTNGLVVLIAWYGVETDKAVKFASLADGHSGKLNTWAAGGVMSTVILICTLAFVLWSDHRQVGSRGRPGGETHVNPQSGRPQNGPGHSSDSHSFPKV